ncbi:hypothetical protein A33M_3307 [Rhodovulum sp. PH10]|uniref:hypothetical protein n=1 Tax=Rhodovulum sp. PH10 TaxID=1187851 RepID=UPI00027C27E8|nr:hypothetical protein [Rhodovulum sp. PH10]EJW11296.1 hypothetical protein A33M_3307 [Rhodovulum sp. PH10]
MDEQGGWLWFFIDVVLVVALAAAMIFGTLQWRRRRTDRAAQAERDRATLESYRKSDQNTAR